MSIRHLLPLTTLVFSCALVLGCGGDKAGADAKKGDDAKKADDGKADAAKGDVEAPPQDEPQPEAPKAPTMEPMAIEAWGVTLQVPAGSKLGELEEGGDGMADTVNIDAEAGCGVELELYRHGKTDTIVEEMFKNASGPSGNKDDQYPIKDQDAEGYTVKKSWVIPLGDTMWAVEVGKVVGDHLIMCGAGSLMGVEQAQAECALEACKSLAANAAAG
ncbi:MAG: hypothetical protein KC431_17525 [Myxococcales bacterium]|nr:hypothetical protein [Myxococcales bacterium]